MFTAAKPFSEALLEFVGLFHGPTRNLAAFETAARRVVERTLELRPVAVMTIRPVPNARVRPRLTQRVG